MGLIKPFKISIDTLTFLADIKRGTLKEFEVNGVPVRFNAFEKWFADSETTGDYFPAKYPYRYALKTFSGLFIQVKEKGSHVQDVRVEFNPNNIEDYSDLFDLVNCLTDIRVTRADFACDYALDLSPFIFTNKTARKTNIFRSADGSLETLYLGCRSSEDQIRIYNKALEQGITDRLWWRIEHQLRFPKNCEIPFSECHPFKDLIIRLTEFHHLKIQEKAILYYLRDHPEGWNELSKNARTKYRKLVKDSPTNLDLPFQHPSDAIESIWERLLYKINSVVFGGEK